MSRLILIIPSFSNHVEMILAISSVVFFLLLFFFSKSKGQILTRASAFSSFNHSTSLFIIIDVVLLILRFFEMSSSLWTGIEATSSFAKEV